jgi:hypothetical protein
MSCDPPIGEVMDEIYRNFMAASTAEHTEPADPEKWTDVLKRISIPGRIHTITVDTYYRFRETIPPKRSLDTFHGFFAVEHGDALWRIFWRVGVRYLCRQLTAEETRITARAIDRLLNCDSSDDTVCHSK